MLGSNAVEEVTKVSLSQITLLVDEWTTFSEILNVLFRKGNTLASNFAAIGKAQKYQQEGQTLGQCVFFGWRCCQRKHFTWQSVEKTTRKEICCNALKYFGNRNH